MRDRIVEKFNHTLSMMLLYLFFFMIQSCSISAQKINFSKNNVLHKKELRILDIGNSYTEDAVSFLPLIVKQSNIDTKDICLYKLTCGGGSIMTWVNTYHGSNTKKYSFRKVLGDLQPTYKIDNITSELNDSILLRNVIDSCRWDIVIIHQVSATAPYYEKYNGLSELLSIIKKHQKEALIGTYLIHSYWDKYNGNIEKSSEERWRLISETTKRICEDYNIDFVIPYGTAIENLRQTSYNKANDLTRDGTHLGLGLAQYTASCCYFETLLRQRYNVSISEIIMNYKVSSDNLSKYGEGCVDVTDSSGDIARKAALYACEDMFGIRNPEDR